MPPRPGISLDSALGTLFIENVLKERMHVQREETRCSGVRRRELSIWYHTLNVGFRTRIAGETDFPCIYDGRVAIGRSYTKQLSLSYANWLKAIKAGRTYVSDGKSGPLP